MRKIFILLLIVFSQIANAQNFNFTCYHKVGFDPVAHFFSNKNIYEEDIRNSLPLKKVSDTSSLLSLKPLVPSFFSIQSFDILVVPNEKASGYFDQYNWKFEITDSSGSNYLLRQLVYGYERIRFDYKVGSNYALFKTQYIKLKKYIDSCQTELNKLTGKHYNPATIAAIKEYLNMCFAHFAVLPVLYNNEYDKIDLKKSIEEYVQITKPELWLQTQPGHIFLRTYYAKIILPSVGYSLKKSLSYQCFLNTQIKKYVSYFYFDECIENINSPHSRNELIKTYNEFKTSYKFTSFELEDINELLSRIQRMGINVTNEFCSQKIENLSGKQLTFEEKKALINGSNIILDYWSSWCVPCRAKMSQLTSNIITRGAKKYKIIYLSIDEERQKWLDVKYPCINSTNSFRLIDNGNNSFIKNYSIESIPRYFLIDYLRLISAHFSY